mmetsp:Transcript_288/g.310  ORF Transcript_288/g.310 Transcript_288/m.310 type:complete len:128 (-) Transcript_288:374-757(-)
MKGSSTNNTTIQIKTSTTAQSPVKVGTKRKIKAEQRLEMLRKMRQHPKFQKLFKVKKIEDFASQDFSHWKNDTSYYEEWSRSDYRSMAPNVMTPLTPASLTPIMTPVAGHHDRDDFEVPNPQFFLGE